MTRKNPPLECALCGMPMWNDENARWSPEPRREPFCSDECLVLANAEYAWNPQRPAQSEGSPDA